jgi:hypothetical protein
MSEAEVLESLKRSWEQFLTETGKTDTTTREARASLYGALAKAQGAFPPIPKDRTVRVALKTGGSYTFSYAPLDTILREVRPALAANGLGITQTFDGERLITLLVHEGGGTIESVLALPRQGSSWQEYGSAVTYARRYAITALLGIASEEDDDGNAAVGNVAQPQERAKPDAGNKTPPAAKKITPKQGDLIHAVLKRLAEHEMLTDEVYHRVLKQEYGVDHSTELTSAQASNLIERLKEFEAKIPKEAPAPAEQPTLTEP